MSFKKELSEKPKNNYNYARKLHLVTPTELSFFKTLLTAVNREHYYIIPQVHLSSLFLHKFRGQSWWGALQHINRKSVDYVICSLEGLNPVCAIELDDASHLRKDRIERDKIVEKLFRQANLPLLRIGVYEKDNIGLLKTKLNSVLIPTKVVKLINGSA